MVQSILFVCLGNICRSPAAEGMFRAVAPEFVSDSAGTASWHAGNAPYAPVQAAMKARGIDISGQRARQITAGDFDRFDKIIVMDGDNRQAVEALRPAGCSTPVELFTAFLDDPDLTHVPDPYYTRDFDGCLELIEEAALALKAALAAAAE